MPSIAIVWFRRDLRVNDHPALAHALGAFDAVVPLFVVDPTLVPGRWPSANRLWFLAGALASLDRELRTRGNGLVIRSGEPATVVPAFAAEIGAAAVVASRDHGPYGRRRDAAVAAALAERGVGFDAGRGLLVHEPEEVSHPDGAGYVVFSPFQRRWLERPVRPVLPAPHSIPSIDPSASSLDPFELLSRPTPTADSRLLLEPTEAAARDRLDRWAASDGLRDYDRGRDRLDLGGTSRLSQDLRWGLLSPIEVLARTGGDGPGPERFRSEIAWRDFYAHLLWHEPRLRRESFRRELDAIAWETDRSVIDAWKDGRTGYPVVDAAMRQLRATGWMPNRARMIVASFLTKHLGVDWRVGEAHFMEHLVDGDPASNSGGWQWAASTGADPQPWFRIFNPTLQGRRYDPDGTYVRRWVPELADRWELVGGDVHEPPAGAYLARIVDHREARRRALARFENAAPARPKTTSA
jgi:deoxyribodipyrimidine photo-lyase